MTATRLTDPDTVGAVAGLMRLLGDQTRVRVLGLLQNGEMNVTALCGRLDLAQPTVSHHLGLLRNAKLVRTRRDGKQIFYALNPEYVTPGGSGDGLRLRYGVVDLQIACEASAGAHGSGPRTNGHPGEVHGNGAHRVSAASF